MSAIIDNAATNPADMAAALLQWPVRANDLSSMELRKVLQILYVAGFTTLCGDLEKSDGISNSTRSALVNFRLSKNLVRSSH